MNYILFDRDFNYLTGGFKRVTTAAREYGQGTNQTEGIGHERLYFDDIVVTQAGYAYIYFSNENESTVEVFFDDFKVEQIKSPVVQMDDYYPFGLAFNSYQRENSTANQYLYNGKEKQDELDLGWMDYGFRMHDPTIGRWSVIDALTEKHKALSPYNYVFNNPVLFIDPLGLDTLNAVTITATRIGSQDWQNFTQTIGYEGYRNFVQTLYQSKLDPYRSEFAVKIYGRDGQGNVNIPDEIEERELEEAEEEALPLLATLWAISESGEDPTSFGYLLNPLAQANFLNSYVQTGLSTEEAKQLVTSVGVQVGIAWLGSYSIKSPNQILVNKTESNGGGITLFQVKNGKRFRIDYDRVNRIHYHRRGTAPGQGIGRHRPWQKKATDKSFWDRF